MVLNFFKKRGSNDDQDGKDEASQSYQPPKSANQQPAAVTHETIIQEWLSQLPEHVRPYRLTDNYPRLAVRMAELWRQPIPLQNYLRGLVLDDRGGRQGFPEEIAGELLRLTSYVEEKIGPNFGVGFGRGRTDWTEK